MNDDQLTKAMAAETIYVEKLTKYNLNEYGERLQWCVVHQGINRPVRYSTRKAALDAANALLEMYLQFTR